LKTKLVLSTLGLAFLITSVFLLYSCSKVAHESLTQIQKEQQDIATDSSAIDEKDITETDEDLLTVDYKEFYDQLSPYGEWIQVNPEDVGLKSKISLNNSSGNKNFSVSGLLGVNTAYADAEMGMVFVWSPSPDLTIEGSVGDVPEYRPYSDGQWINSDEGWYFRGRTPYEETVSHHGRWVHSPHAGWLWVPGRVWAPAWVDWRQNDDYVSWAPLPPSAYFSDGNLSVSLIDDNDYEIVERRHFCDPDIYRYYNPYGDDGNRISISIMTGTVGLVFSNNMIINRGPDIYNIQNIYGRNFDPVNIHHVRDFKEVRYSDREYNVYSPGFNRYKNKDNKENKNFVRNEPKSFKNFNEVNQKNSAGNDYKNENKQTRKDNGNQQKGNDNLKKNSGNENVKQQKSNDNVKQQKGNNNVKQQKGNNNVKQQKGNDNVKQQKGNNNVKQQKGNNNVKQQKGNNNVKQQKGNNNVKQQKGNDNVKQQKGNNNVKQQKGNNNVSQQKGNNNVSQQKGNNNQNKQSGNDKGKEKK